MTIAPYAAVFRITIAEKLTYRWNFLLTSCLRFLPLASQMILWEAVAGDRDVAGYSLASLAGYYFLTYVARGFSGMAGMDRVMVREIRDGTLNCHLVRPFSYLGYHLAARAAHKAVFMLMAGAPYLAVYLLLAWRYDLSLALYQVPWGVLSLFLGFLLGFFIMTLVGLWSFWLLEASSFAFILMMIEYFLSGHMFPLDMLNALHPGLKDVALGLPFAYETYFPAAVLLGKVRGAELYQGLLTQAGWVLLLGLAVSLVYRRGLKRYQAAGG